jgi:hypothetical protein
MEYTNLISFVHISHSTTKIVRSLGRYGIRDYCAQLERLASEIPSFDDRCAFTSSSCSVGECKIFLVLELVVRATGSPDKILAEFPRLLSFYSNFRSLPATQRVLDKGGKFPRAADGYFLTVEETRASLEKKS